MEPADSSPVSPSLFYERFRQGRFPILLPASIFAFFLCLFLILYVFWWRAPKDFPTGASVVVRQGMTAGEIATMLGERGVIRSPFWFKAWSIVLGGQKGVKAGEYSLSAPLSVFGLAKRLARGLQNLERVRVLIPEGLSNAKVAGVFARSLKKFDRERFLSLAKEKEGYLFPDTYTFYSNTTEADVVAVMEENFEKRMLPLQKEITEFGKPLHDILTMASLVEGEARTSVTRKQIAGILWKRLEIGMPLQVDAVFPYILGKNTYEVTAEDLKVDSPYNTYKYAGLPPGPINNPSLDAIEAALKPTPTKYLYYLTDKEGAMRYATTHAQHLVNRTKYLGK